MGKNTMRPLTSQATLPAASELLALAKKAGADEAKIIAAELVRVDETLAGYCSPEGCPNYGLALSCPPLVEGPQVFRQWLENACFALVLRLETPAAVLFSEQRTPLMRRLHRAAATVEQAAVKAGYAHSRAFAGGSCKISFCGEYDSCAAREEKEQCRFPDQARQSMSGFGVDVRQLMKACGWSTEITIDPQPDDALAWVAGLVLIG
jgi:predicted metal-binding protein